MQELIMAKACWFVGSKKEVLNRLRGLSRTYGNISMRELLRLLQH